MILLKLPHPESLIERRAFLELPTELRHNLLKEQAERMVEYYKHDSEWRTLEGEELVKYESN